MDRSWRLYIPAPFVLHLTILDIFDQLFHLDLRQEHHEKKKWKLGIMVHPTRGLLYTLPVMAIAVVVEGRPLHSQDDERRLKDSVRIPDPCLLALLTFASPPETTLIPP